MERRRRVPTGGLRHATIHLEGFDLVRSRFHPRQAVWGNREDKDVSFRQVHVTDGGRVRYQRVCEKCGEVLAFADIAKGYEASDGRMAILSDEDFENLPLKTLKSVDVVQFVEEQDVDPTYFQRTYFLEAEAAGQKPYVLLREALAKESKVAVVKVALRSRESPGLDPCQGRLAAHAHHVLARRVA